MTIEDARYRSLALGCSGGLSPGFNLKSSFPVRSSPWAGAMLASVELDAASGAAGADDAADDAADVPPPCWTSPAAAGACSTFAASCACLASAVPVFVFSCLLLL